MMGLSNLKGNSGYIGVDKRGETASTGTTGNVSIQKHYLERLRGNFTPPVDLGNVLFQDNFSSGTFTSPQVGDAWTVLNGTEPSEWVIGTSGATLNEATNPQTIPSGSTYAAFISNDSGVSNDYASSTNVHMYFEFTIPSSLTISSLTLEFDWMCKGEISSSGGESWDFGYLTYINTSSLPSAGTPIGDVSTSTQERIKGTNTSTREDNGRFNGDDRDGDSVCREPLARDQWVYENITLDSTEISGGSWCSTDCTRAIVFSFTSDSSLTDNPGWSVSNVKLTYSE